MTGSLRILIKRIEDICTGPQAATMQPMILSLCQILAQADSRFVPMTPLSDPAALADPAFWCLVADHDDTAVVNYVEECLALDLISAARAARSAGRHIILHGTGAVGERALSLLTRIDLVPDMAAEPQAYRNSDHWQGLPVISAEDIIDPRHSYVIIGSSYPAVLDRYLAQGFQLRDDVIQ